MKDFLLSAKSREFFVFLFFFVVAAGFWLLQTLNKDYETEFAIPVKLKGIPDDVVITSEPVPEVRVKVKDKGTVLLNYMLGKSFYPVTLDFSEYASKDSHVKVFASQFSRMIKSQLNISTALLSVKPDTLEYIYATGSSKHLPVKLRGTVSAGRQYYLTDTVFRPDTVWVYAPKAVLDTMDAVYTQFVDMRGMSDTLNRRIPLEVSKGVKVVPSTVEVMFPVDVYTEKTVEVPVRGMGFPKGKVLRTFPSKVQVTFQVGVSRFRQINAEDFHILVPYNELLQSGADKYTIKMGKLPEGVSQVRVSPAQIDFLIEQIPGHYD